MSTTINNILHLPCMHEAKVAVGENLLDRTVSSVTVLEYTKADELQATFQLHEGPRFNELTITAMFDICDDPDEQCKLIRSLMNYGVFAMVLFYLGIVVKKLHPKVLKTAEEIGFIIITMPPKRLDLRYGDAIMEISGLINEGRLRDSYFIPELLDQFSLIPSGQRNTDILLRMVSDRTQISLLITDAEWRVQHCITWPVGLSLDIASIIEQVTDKETALNISGMQYAYQVIRLKSHNVQLRNLVVFSTDPTQLQSYAKQAGELVCLSNNIWNMQYDDIGAGADELIRALIIGEPLRIQHLAKLLGIDLRGLNTMWILQPDLPNGSKTIGALKEMLALVKKLSDSCLPASIVGQYEKSIILVAQQPDYAVIDYVEKQLLALIDAGDEPFHVFFCNHLDTPQRFHDTYLRVIEHVADAARIFPLRRAMSLQEILFAEECRHIMEQGDDTMRQYTAAFDMISCADAQLTQALRKTLAVLLIDAEESISKTAKLLFVHPNTIKYRLKKINEMACANVLQMPLNYTFTRAAALLRLMKDD